MEPQSAFGDTLLKFQVVCPQNGTAVPKGLIGGWQVEPIGCCHIPCWGECRRSNPGEKHVSAVAGKRELTKNDIMGGGGYAVEIMNPFFAIYNKTCPLSPKTSTVCCYISIYVHKLRDKWQESAQRAGVGGVSIKILQVGSAE